MIIFRVNKAQPAVVPMSLEVDEESTLPTMTEAIAIFEKQEVPVKLGPAPIEVLPKNLPSAQMLSKMGQKTNTDMETAVPEATPQKFMPPAKTLADALKPFILPENPSLDPKPLGDAIQVDGPAVVPMSLEVDEESTLPTMTEAIAIFEKQEVPVKLGPAPIEVLPKNLPSAQMLSKMGQKTNTDMETAVPEATPQKFMPPAKTIADALKPFILPENPSLDPKPLGDAIQVEGLAVVPMSLEVDEESTLPTMTEAIAIFEKQEVPVKLGPAPIEVLPKNLPSAQMLSKMEPKTKTDMETVVPEPTQQKMMPPAKTLADALKPFILPEKPFLEPEMLGDAIDIDGPIQDVSLGQRTDRDKGLDSHRIVPGEELNYRRYGNGCSIMF